VVVRDVNEVRVVVMDHVEFVKISTFKYIIIFSFHHEFCNFLWLFLLLSFYQ